MKKILLTSLALLVCCLVHSQNVEFSDDFESGTANWVLEGTWGTTMAHSNSGDYSLADSPGGNYLSNQNITATMAIGVDLSGVPDANLKFGAIYDIEAGNFDFCYVEASGNGGATWETIASFLGEDNSSPWVEYTYSLSDFVGSSDVKIRFRFFSDGATEYDGIYIDDFQIISSSGDDSPPVVTHDPPQHYESNIGAVTMFADLEDASGISSTFLKYKTNGGSEQSVAGTNESIETWSFIIPGQTPGSQVDYYIEATDNSPNAHKVMTDTFSYISGHHIFYDNAVDDEIKGIGPDATSGFMGCAVRMTLTGTTDIVYALIRNYTDANKPNNDFEFHIWADDSGMPGADMITPFMVTPEANLVEMSPMTRIDLSAYSNELAGLTGDFFVGFTVPFGQTWLAQSNPAIGGRSYTFNGNNWTANVEVDFHFRVVATQFETPDDCADAADLSSMIGREINMAQTSPLWDNSSATVAGNEPTEGTECWFDETIDNPLWFTFEGDGGTYQITTTNCNGTAENYIDDGDTQIAIFSGGNCGSLSPMVCDDDGGVEPDIYAAFVEIETTPGTTYYMMIDGYDGAYGEYCVEITRMEIISCLDISVGNSSGEQDICFDEMTSFMIDNVVIPTGSISGFNWVVTTEDISFSTDPYNEPSLVKTFDPTDDPYGPEMVNDGTQIPEGTYFFTPVVFGGAMDTDGTLPGFDFSDGCIEVGNSIEVELYEEFGELSTSSSSVDETFPPGNNGEASVTVTGGSGFYSYEWSNGAETQTITGLSAGDYTVTISDNSGCVDDWIEIVNVDAITGNRDLAFEQSIKLNPSHAASLTRLTYDFGEAVNLKIAIINGIGQLVEERIIDNAVNGTIEFDLGKFTEGVYFIQLTDGEHHSTKMLVVTK